VTQPVTQRRSLWPGRFTWIALLLVGGSLVLSVSCDSRSSRRGAATRPKLKRSNDSAYLVDALATGLNNLPREIVLELQPPQPILDDSKSADGQPVLAACNVTPAVPDGPFNFLYVPKGNANFRRLGVRSGDIVRYFINRNQDSVEHGIEQVDFIELPVRRLDTNDPNNALIFEGGLSNAVEFPERIEIWRFSDKRMNEIRQRITRYVQQPRERISWEPTPDESALEQLLERANQWLRNLPEDGQSWETEPLVSQLPAALRETKPLAALLAEQSLKSGPFAPSEAQQLQQAIWLRDISRWAKGEATAPVEVARALFDWTVRNIQLDSPDQPGYVHQPWQALMYGHGTARHRAWVFAELCRQQQLDVVMLAADGQWWLPALFDEGQLTLFDSRLGLPIAGPELGSVATLAQVVAEPTLLSDLDIAGEDAGEDVEEEHKYPVTAEMLDTITAWPVATPLQLAERARLLEQSLRGDDFVVLSANVRQLAEELAKQTVVDDVQLWPFPLESVLAENTMSPRQRLEAGQRFLAFAQRPRLWKARVLHFQGTKDIPLEQRNDPLAQPDLGHRQATALYQDPRIRPPNVLLERIDPTKRALYLTVKGDASYWLGLLSYDLGKYQIAEDWLARRTLAATPNGPWTASARYNLARTHEALGDLPAAIELLESEDSPQRHGNLLRARRLRNEE